MARRGTKSIVMYTTNEPELEAAFERVHNHLGRTYTRSGIMAELVRRKDEEIREGRTRRDQIAGMREDIAALIARMVALEERLGMTDYDTDHG